MQLQFIVVKTDDNIGNVSCSTKESMKENQLHGGHFVSQSRLHLN